MPLLTTEELSQMSPLFRGRGGQWLAGKLMQLVRVDELNELYDRNAMHRGADFATAVLDDRQIDYLLGNAELLDKLPQGPFITISNHPCGHIDGIMLIEIFARIRPGFKVMVNKILGRVKAMEDNFITVIPTGRKRDVPQKESLLGVKAAISQVRSGEPVGFFPSGAVSDLSLRDRCVRDREWQEAMMKLIRKLRVPIVPVRFFDGNSRLYYLLGLLFGSGIRLLRLPAEVLDKREKPLRLGIGPVIDLEAQDACTDLESYAKMLRDSVYGMPLPETFLSRGELLGR